MGGKGGGKGKDDRPAGRPVTLQKMASGQALCAGYNTGSCNEGKKKCVKTTPELHRCNGKIPGKQVACAQNHMSKDCTKCERA